MDDVIHDGFHFPILFCDLVMLVPCVLGVEGMFVYLACFFVSNADGVGELLW